MPRMAFIGVRISWLTLARNSLLARLAASAASLARRSASSVRFWSSMSVMVPSHLTTWPDSSRTGRPRLLNQR